MRINRPLRVMWLLNHTSARKFEIPMLKKIGMKEIFTPKSYPQETSFRFASVCYEEDSFLTIPPHELAILNAQDWYGSPSKQAWDIANQYFDILFFILFKPEILKNIANNFQGAALWRAYGMLQENTHGNIAKIFAEDDAILKIKSLGRRFWFAQGHPQLHEVEPHFISSRRVYLPLGLTDSNITDGWKGSDRRIYFVCPDIEINAYHKSVFEWFRESFKNLPYAVGGAQSIQSDYPEVLGYVPHEAHERNIKEFRLMFYHSTDPNHIHYHPFEAIRAGMPLIFMAGGMLDHMGGDSLPGRCKSVKEAKSKIERVLNNDYKLIENIRQSQSILLDRMKAENCEQNWINSFQSILADLEESRLERIQRPQHIKRIAVVVPIGYRGGSLRSAKLLAQAIYQGSRQYCEPTEVIFLHLDDPKVYGEDEFIDLFSGVKRRAFKWKTLQANEARRAMRYAGYENWEPQAAQYGVVDDGIKQLYDCDLWIVVSDRLTAPLLPLRPSVHIVYDYLQRYVPTAHSGADQVCLDVVKHAACVLVTTEFTRLDALQYAGLPPHKVVKVPMLAPDFSNFSALSKTSKSHYFLWTTNAQQHKNQLNALKALKWYYEELNGQLECHVSGVNTSNITKNPPSYLIDSANLIKENKSLRQHIHWLGELPDKDYQKTLAESAFLWHAGTIDNGTFSVIEAASVGVPALSSDYPAMREIDQQFGLKLAWMDANNPIAMAEQLKQIELTYQVRRLSLPTKIQLADQNAERLASEYWKAIRECL